MNRKLTYFTVLAILIVGVVVYTVPASAGVGFNGIGVRLGFVSPEDGDETIGFGAVADLGTFTDDIHWDASLCYWGNGEEVPGIEWSWKDIALRSAAKYFFPVTGSSVSPYAGGGLGIHFFSSEVTWTGHPLFGDQSESDSETKFGFFVVGGAEMVLSDQFKGSAEVQYDLVEDINQFNVQVNLIYMLQK